MASTTAGRSWGLPIPAATIDGHAFLYSSGVHARPRHPRRSGKETRPMASTTAGRSWDLPIPVNIRVAIFKRSFTAHGSMQDLGTLGRSPKAARPMASTTAGRSWGRPIPAAQAKASHAFLLQQRCHARPRHPRRILQFRPAGINNGGQVVGEATVNGNGPGHAFLFTAAVPCKTSARSADRKV